MTTKVFEAGINAFQDTATLTASEEASDAFG